MCLGREGTDRREQLQLLQRTAKLSLLPSRDALPEVHVCRGKHSWLRMSCGKKKQMDRGELSEPASWNSQYTHSSPVLIPLAVVPSFLFT